MVGSSKGNRGLRRVRAVLPVIIILSSVFQTGCAQIMALIGSMVANGPVNPNAAAGGGNLLAAGANATRGLGGAVLPAPTTGGANIPNIAGMANQGGAPGPLGLPNTANTAAAPRTAAVTPAARAVTPAPAVTTPQPAVVTPPPGGGTPTPVQPAARQNLFVSNDQPLNGDVQANFA